MTDRARAWCAVTRVSTGVACGRRMSGFDYFATFRTFRRQCLLYQDGAQLSRRTNDDEIGIRASDCPSRRAKIDATVSGQSGPAGGSEKFLLQLHLFTPPAPSRRQGPLSAAWPRESATRARQLLRAGAADSSSGALRFGMRTRRVIESQFDIHFAESLCA